MYSGSQFSAVVFAEVRTEQWYIDLRGVILVTYCPVSGLMHVLLPCNKCNVIISLKYNSRNLKCYQCIFYK